MFWRFWVLYFILEVFNVSCDIGVLYLRSENNLGRLELLSHMTVHIGATFCQFMDLTFGVRVIDWQLILYIVCEKLHRLCEKIFGVLQKSIQNENFLVVKNDIWSWQWGVNKHWRVVNKVWRSLKVAKVEFIFHSKQKEDWMIKKESNFKFSVQILKVKQLFNKNRLCTMKKERWTRMYWILRL